MVAVFEQVHGLRGATRADVDRHHRLDPRELAPAHELVESELIGFGGVPREVQARGPFVNRADAVLPPVRRHEVPAGIANGGDAEFAHQLEHIATESLRRRRGVSWLVDARVDAPSQMFHE